MCTLSFTGISQNDSVAKNVVYIDFGGAGVFGSINFSRKFYSIKKFDFDAHIGISTTKITDFRNKINPQLILPVGVHIAFGKTHYIELGLGCAYENHVRANANFNPKRYHSFNGNSSLGYKFQKIQGCFLFRAFYSPIFERFKTMRHWGGLSFGYAF